jgi:hypothetical protein
MATKQAQINFDDIDVSVLDETQQQDLEKQLIELTKKIDADKKAKKELAKKDVYDNLLKVASLLDGKEIINFLLKYRKIEFKTVQEIKPIYLIDCKVSKKKRNSTESEQKDFKFYENKVILADTAQAEQICANGVDEFKKTFTQAGNEYFNNVDTSYILVNFYNEHKPANVPNWKL